MLEWFKGRKTYFIAGAAAALAFCDAMGWPVPEYVYVLLAALGLGALRAGVNKGGPPSGTVGCLLPFVILPLLGVGVAGCSLLTPGLDTRTAAEANSTTSWDKDSNLNLRESTTHNRKTVAAEGDGVEIEYYESGAPKKISGATHVLSQVSEPRDVMEGYMHLANKNAEVGLALMRTMETIMPMIGRLIARGEQVPATVENQLQDALQGVDRGELRLFLQRRGVDPAVVDYIVGRLPTSQPG